MTLQSSGTITIAQINAEFGRGNNLNSYRGTTWYTDAGGSGTFSSGAISMSDFYGKRLTSPTFSFSIASNQTNANLRTLAVNAGWNQTSTVVATINSGVYISSNSTGTPALTINGSFPGGVTLINNGNIIGMGGNGGSATNALTGIGGAGGAGGGALLVQSAVTISNAGTIGGGGGGGGAGSKDGTGSGYSYNSYIASGGGGGGGGRSSAAANSGAGSGSTTRTADLWYPGTAGGAGTSAAAGGGGTGGGTRSSQGFTVYGGNGGGGGGWGASGSNSQSGTGLQVAGGGGGGYAVSGNGYVTWTATGTRLGAIS